MALSIVHVANVFAEEQADIVTDEQRSLIISNCSDLQATLNRIHQNDALARHDQGQLFRLISDKLMAPLNQRIASNQLDGSTLVLTTATYNTQYQNFYNAYKAYEQSLRTTLQIDCTKQPVVFYDSLTDARNKRALVHEAGAKLIQLAQQYRDEFTTFRTNVAKQRSAR